MVTALSEDSIVVGKIKIAADVRTNRIHVITRPINMRFIRKLIAEFDANVEFGKPVTRPLRYISAADILPVLVQALTEPGTNGQGADAGAGAAPGANPQQPRPRSNHPRTRADSIPTDSGSGLAAARISQRNFPRTAVDTTPKAVTIGNAKIIADQRANTIIVLGNREVVVKVMKILDEMDVKAPQVALEYRDWRTSARTRTTSLESIISRDLPSSTRTATVERLGSPIILGRPGFLIRVVFSTSRSWRTQQRGRPPELPPTFLSNAGNSLTAIVRMLRSDGQF